MNKSTLNIFLFCVACIMTSCSSGFSAKVLEIINSGDEQTLMYIYEITNPNDTSVLRNISDDLSRDELNSKDYARLTARMLHTVTDSTVDGVGIAAPQVGINKRVIAVQRFDKVGEPFETYANIRIMQYCGTIKNGMEGCLSVPNRTESVPRHDTIIISYLNHKSLLPVLDTISGFTAVIFQHEIDHLEGQLYIDINTHN